MTYDVVTLTPDDREAVLASGVPLEQAHAVARAHCGLPSDAVGIVEDECTVYTAAEPDSDTRRFATVTPRRQ